MFRRALYKCFGLLAEGKIRRFNAATQNPAQAQAEKLLKIIRANEETAFGADHKFKNISSVKDFQAQVPIRDYEGFRPYIDRATQGEKKILTAAEPLMYATTSGTTGLPKYIPVTPGYIKEFRLASVVSGYHLLKNYPQIAGGVSLSVASPAEEGKTKGGTPYGAISGMLFQSEPHLIKKYISPIPYEVYLISDYETRYYTLLRLALVMPVSFFYTLNPSTISLLCRKLQTYGSALVDDIRAGTITPPAGGKLDGRTINALQKYLKPAPERAKVLSSLLAAGEFYPHKIWPTLSLVSCWTKAAASFYLADFPQYFGSVPVCDITYGASEGRGTVFMGPGLQVLAIQSHFFEFVAEEEMENENPKALLAHEVQVGRNYFILFTTSGGLYRYNINDVVKVTGFHNATPLLEFQYKGGNISSFTGEKITELQVTAAVRRAAEAGDQRLRFFTVIPTFKPEPHYQVWAEPELDGLSEADQDWAKSLGLRIDEQLAVENSEYKVKRDSLRLAPMQVRLLNSGSYERFRKFLTGQGVADAQIKVSHLNPKEEVRKHFEAELLDNISGRLPKSLSGI
ncbi:MAG: GH3 auxin-responsive promoter family protein [Cyanobacteria bacterium SZAS TMP-1]|nr:GH3 auxin-responsive promoter family protein [Cyanobacteria bacterium SZAS TMP-1]